jgi:hypothetical protein
LSPRSALGICKYASVDCMAIGPLALSASAADNFRSRCIFTRAAIKFGVHAWLMKRAIV